MLPEHSPKHVAALADRDVVGEGRLERRQQVLRPARRLLDDGPVTFQYPFRAPGAKPFERASLGDLVARADLHDLDRIGIRALEAVDTHHHALTRFNPLLKSVGALADTLLGPPRVDARDR